MSRVGGKLGKIELNLEIHLIDKLPVDLIVGMDAICAYGIDTIVSRSMATLSINKCDLAFPIEFRRPNGTRNPESGFPVVCSESVTIPPLHESLIQIVSGFNFHGDAWLHLAHVKNDTRLWSPMDGGWLAEGLTDARQRLALFANLSHRPLRLRRGQVVGHITPCGVRDSSNPTTITHRPGVHSPSMLSCVPKGGSPANFWALLDRPSFDAAHPTDPASPAILIDPHNRDPPVSPSPGPADTLFDVSSAYGINHSPPAAITDVLNASLAAFSFDGVPGVVDSVRIDINTNDDNLFAEPPRQVGPHKRKIIDDSITQLLSWDVIEPSNSRVSYPVVLVRQHDK